MKPQNAVLTAAVLLLALGAPLCTAQSQLPVKAVVFTIRGLAGGADADFDQLLSEAVRLEIENAGYTVVDGWEKLLEAGEKAPVHGPRAAELARGVDAALAITGYYTRPDAGSVALSVQCWETAGETLLASFTLSAPFDLSYYNLLHERLGALVASAEKFTGPPRIEAIEVAAARGLGTITFRSAQDGIEVLLAGEKSLGTIADGRLEASVGLLSTGSRLELELRKSGFHTLETAATAIPEIRLPELLPARRIAVDLAWNSGQPLGVGGTFNWCPIPDWVFVGGAAHLSAQLPPWGATDEYTVLHFDVGARAGVYLLPIKPQLSLFGAALKLPFRVGVVTGFGAMPSFSFAPGHPVWLDWYILAPAPFLEIGTKDTVITFRMDQRYSLGLPGSAIARGWIMRQVPDESESDGTRDVLPVQLGVTFKW
ncbi:MAG: hypothetical protein NTU62_01880 [Spirochaetes bacterium]|nr:hypothetical protein [Spirochaetota bacterium]